MVVKTMVVYVRSNVVNDIFNIVRVNTVTHEWSNEFVEYPRTMSMTEDDVRMELED